MSKNTQTVSLRLSASDLAEMDRIAERLSVERPLMIKRFIKEGLQGMLDYEKSGEPFNWPRDGQMRFVVDWDLGLTEGQERQILEKMTEEAGAPLLPKDESGR
jgi:predicted DNA-binding protein